MNSKLVDLQKPKPDPDEWDFRKLDKSTDLCTVIEYEYLRSSNLRQTIENWLDSDFWKTQFAKFPENGVLLKKIKLLDFPEGFPLDRLDHYRSDPNSLEVSQALQLETKALKQIAKLRRPKCTVREAIRKFSNRLENPMMFDSALCLMKFDLPYILQKNHAERIALKFDRFPEPWLSIQRSPGGLEYLRKRYYKSAPSGAEAHR